MAVLIWTGATDGDFTKAANYIDEGTGTAPGSGPANSDTVKFDRGAVDVDAGLTAGLTGITLIGTKNYLGRIGPSAALQIACASIRWSAGHLNLHGNITTGNIACRRGSKFVYTSGTASNLFLGCDASIAAAAVVTNLRVKGPYVVDDLDNATGYTIAHLLKGGRLMTKRGGKVDVGQSSRAVFLVDAPIAAASVIRSGGVCEYRSSADTGGSVEVEPDGYFDASQSPKAFTISSLLRWEGARINTYTQAGAATISSETVYGLSLDGMVTGEGAIPL